MVSKVLSATVIGLDAQLVQVEVHFSKGKSKFFIVGLPDKACSESKERVAAIIRNFLGRRLPAGIFTVNLAPADILKSGPVYDLPIAIGILNSLRKMKFEPKGRLVIGELSLDGRARHTNAILPIADLARKKGLKELFLPDVNAKEASIIPKIKIFPVKSLNQIVRHVRGGECIEKFKNNEKRAQSDNLESEFDFSNIIGQDHAKRALEIAAAGGHNILLVGPPGSGKTLLSRTLPTILPQLLLEESLEVTRIYSVAGLLSSEVGLIQTRPFRKPHHTISHVALVGGGTIPRPGEVSLAHRGVLFLDEFGEFSNKALESLRQPLEDGVITISRAKKSLTFPAKIILVAAMNPCKCGWLGDDKRECTCTPSEIIRYRKKISGPILDRIDMKVTVRRVEFEKINSKVSSTKEQAYLSKSRSSKVIRNKVKEARGIQLKRFGEKKIVTNSEIGQKDIAKFIPFENKCNVLLRKAMEVMNFSARGYFRLLKVARTIADLEGKEVVCKSHIAEALSFRMEEAVPNPFK